MQRQSLGSPGSKLHVNGGFVREEEKRSGSGGGGGGGVPEADEEIKAEKLIRSNSRTTRTVHLIPILTILCFLILYLCSHEPSPKDLPSIRGVERLLDPKGDSISEIGRYLVAESGGVSAIRNQRGLMEDKKLRHRKLGIP